MKSPATRLFAAALAFTTTTFAQDPAPSTPSPAVIKLGLGYDYSRGDYGFTQETEVSSITSNFSYDQGRWSFKAQLPFITIEGPASVAAGTTPVAAPGRPTTGSESGLGDATVSATYHANPTPGELNYDFTTRVKLPTADKDKGLGTGEADVYVQTDLYQNLGAITPFATLGYRFMGTSAMYPLKDGFYATAGAAFRASDTIVIGAAYDWRSRIIAGAEHGTDALAFIAANPNDRWSLLAYGLAGFNDASPDFGIGTLATYKF